MIRLVRGGLTLRLELPEAPGHVLDILQLTSLDVIITSLEFVEWIHLSDKVGGASSEAFAAMEADAVVPTDRGDVFIQGGHRLKL